ncbi:dihydroorotate dehydrogenase, partial [Micromonospora sp. NRRL B-16802]
HVYGPLPVTAVGVAPALPADTPGADAVAALVG